jgi:hypothetical protein
VRIVHEAQRDLDRLAGLHGRVGCDQGGPDVRGLGAERRAEQSGGEQGEG